MDNMPMHADFKKIYARFKKQYGPEQGKEFYFAWLKKKGYDDTKPLPTKQEKKEHMCSVVGVEIKENDLEFHVEGLIATSHIDDYDIAIGISDKIPKSTLESFATQINSSLESRVMGVHHSEGRPINPEYYGIADIDVTPAKVISLNDGEYGLYVDTKLLKDDPATPSIINDFKSKTLNAFSVTYDTDRGLTTDFEFVGDEMIRVLNPKTQLRGYTAANNPVNKNAIATDFGFKEFKELVRIEEKNKKSVDNMGDEENKPTESVAEAIKPETEKTSPESNTAAPVSEEDNAEKKEFLKWKSNKKVLEEKELLDNAVTKIADGVLSKLEVKEKVLRENNASESTAQIPLEIKAFNDSIKVDSHIEIKEQFIRGAIVCDKVNLDWQSSVTAPAESREFKNFGTNGRFLEYKGLGITTNQNSDTDYIQSSAELQDVYDPIIYNALNQATVFWNLLAKDNYSGKGNNQVQFKLKIAANTTAAFYTGNSVATGNVDRLKYQTKFKKLQVGVSVDGDMIAAARGGPVSDVFALEVMDSTDDMLAVLNAALFAETGLETASGVIGLEYITDSAGNTTLYNLTRSTTNKLAPASAGDTYINMSSAVISMTNLRKAKRQALNEAAKKKNLCYVTNPTQGDMLRGKFDDSRRMLTARDTDFGFSTDLWIDGIPVYEDKDCNTDDIFLVDLETHRAAIWVPPTIERLGKTADQEDAFIKMYVATYNTAPRRMVQIYGCATS